MLRIVLVMVLALPIMVASPASGGTAETERYSINDLFAAKEQITARIGSDGAPTFYIAATAFQPDGGGPALTILDCDPSGCDPSQARQLFISDDLGGIDVTSDDAGNPVLATWEGFVRCSDPGCTSSTTTPYGGPVEYASLSHSVAVDVTADGRPIAAMRSSGQLNFAACDDPGCASVTVHPLDGPDAGGPAIAVYGVEMVVGSDGLPMIAYLVDEEELRIVDCNDVNCSGGDDPVRTLATELNFDRIPEITRVAGDVASDGRPVFGIPTGEGPTLYRCDDPSCTAATPSAPLNEFRQSNAVLALLGDDRAVVAYESNANRQVALAVCADAGCTDGPEEQTVFSTGGINDSEFADVLLRPDGTTLLTFHDRDNSSAVDVDDESLRVADCDDPICDPNAAEGGVPPSPDPAPGGPATPPNPDPGPDPDPGVDEDAQVVAAAIEISGQRFADDPGVGEPQAAWGVLSRTGIFADSLSGSGLSGGGPMLFTDPETMDQGSLTELQRVLSPGDRVFLLGGVNALSDAVEASITGAGFTPVRLSGPSRVETSLAIARQIREVGGSGRVMLARAGGPADNPTAAWADSVSAGAFAADQAVPVILTPSEELHPAVQEELEMQEPKTVYLLGGEAALSAAVAAAVPNPIRISGDNRYATAVAIADELWENPSGEFLVTAGNAGSGWAYGLAAAGLGAQLDAPLLLVETVRLPAETDAALCRAGSRARTTVIGGIDIVDQSVREELASGC